MKNVGFAYPPIYQSLTNSRGSRVAGAGWMSRVGKMIFREIQVRALVNWVKMTSG